MKKVLVLSVATCLLAGASVAQTQTPTRPNPPNATVAPPDTVTGQSHNPAVAATSNANDTAAPAKGSNSFTEAQAKDRIGQRGYANVSDLRKDDAGVWRGHAQHSGSNVQVWLDYKGNVGETP
jgi:hypothetical protein